MIAEWIRPPNNVVESKRQPCERLVRAEMKTGKHPSQFRPCEPSVGQVVDESLIVPINKSILQNRKKRPACDQDNHNEP